MIARVLIVAALILIPGRADDPEGAKLLKRLCGQCHKLEMVTSRRLTKEGWTKTVQAMVDKGADASDEEFSAVIEYLAKYYGDRLNVNKAAAAQIATFLDVPETEAAAIVRYREVNGDFKSWQDLMKVPGVEGKKVEAKKDRLEF